MYNNPFYNYYNRPSVDDINNRIQELEKIKGQIQQPMQVPTNLTQNFSLAPSNEMIRYVNGVEEVQKMFVIGDTPYFSKDLKTLWIKNARGEIKTYEVNEVVKKDEKDLRIEELLNELENVKKEMRNNERSDELIDEPIKSEKSSTRKSNTKSNE